MKKITKLHFALIPILVVISFGSYYFLEPWDKIYILLFIGSFLSCSFVGWSAIIRDRKTSLLTLNPFAQAKAASEVSLNSIEKTILLYAICILVGCFGGLLFSPIVSTIWQ